MRQPKPATTALRCPKCRSRSFSLIEVIEAIVTWDVIDGRTDKADGALEPCGPIYLRAECGCGHRWRLRAVNVDQVLVEDTAP